MAFTNIHTQTLGEIFQSQFPFYVPKYQRGYAWESEEISDFIRDLSNHIAVDSSEAHFLGGLVHVHMPSTNSVSRKHEIVDGQQRMATFTLAIASIVSGIQELEKRFSSKSFKNRCSAQIEEIQEQYLIYKELEGGKRVKRAKLTMSRVDSEFFHELVGGSKPTPGRESHRRILAAYEKLKADLVDPELRRGLKGPQVLETLRDLSKKIATSLIVIHIVSDSRKEAYRLFSVLNDRGRNLSDGDLLRARTLELIESNQDSQGRVEAMWDRILDGTEDSIDKFLKAYYPSTLGSRAPKKGLFDAYESAFLAGRSVTEIEEFVKALDKEKPNFVALSSGEWPFPVNARSVATQWDIDRLYRLVNVLRHEAAHPLLLSAVKLGEKKFIEMLRVLERFVFRYINIVGAHPSPLYSPYYTESVSIRKRSSTYSINSLTAKLKPLISSKAGDELFKDALRAKVQYSEDSSRNRIIKHFLTTLESYRGAYEKGKHGRQLKPECMVVFDLTSTTIEHIYPQTAKASNKSPGLEPLKDRLGNLTVLGPTDNSSIGNADFTAKKVEFARSSVGMNRKIAQLASWSEAELAAREEELLQMASIVFDV